MGDMGLALLLTVVRPDWTRTRCAKAAGYVSASPLSTTIGRYIGYSDEYVSIPTDPKWLRFLSQVKESRRRQPRLSDTR